MKASEMTPQQLAEAASEALHLNDHAAKGMGISIDEVAPGYAKLSMVVRKDMLNGHSTCHGGMMFALCDTAFAHACNSYNRSTVASGCTIDFIAPGFEGDTLTAIAQERSRSGRTGVYDITLSNQEGTELGFFRGKAYQIKGTLIAED
ncbi:hydroxyphenylacetyl-CoA thioesterase PaaI [Amphritea sp. 1_MG-2023]|uniref:hydroxyphenylacetyl-CoA thioesterase PaaI n=1 Tax=Amphritea sp. 1_MG-2023 TaxID=3062670 RepID=UPI0026E3C517|nr:hydroxyphenylacetyl-CoA thioesterase PaaI [Amphritea sp. 1_MG-2023]MDO6563138.1 hydroxyphenylacetyl-CoA thioesterase PaaI [Amphritea sp. 1_MG-2023]